MKTIFLIFGLTFLFTISFAKEPTIEVECRTEVKTQVQTISLRLNEKRVIIQWDKNHMAKADENSIFTLLTESPDSFEYVNSFKVRNGYSILQVGTTADELIIGISKSLNNGIFKYKDQGSGNGDSDYFLDCLEK